jgi:hypothetical protein
LDVAIKLPADTESAASSVRGQYHSIAHALPDKTKSALTFVQFAKSWTQPALDAPVGQHRPPAAGIIGLRQLCDHFPQYRSGNPTMQELRDRSHRQRLQRQRE